MMIAIAHISPSKRRNEVQLVPRIAVGGPSVFLRIPWPLRLEHLANRHLDYRFHMDIANAHVWLLWRIIKLLPHRLFVFQPLADGFIGNLGAEQQDATAIYLGGEPGAKREERQ